MFKEFKSGSQTKGDFQVSLIDISGGTAKIRIGPRFRAIDFTNPFPIEQKDGVFSDFYSPDFSPAGQTAKGLFEILKNDKTLGGVETISQYIPSYVLPNGSLSEKFTGGEFKIPVGKKTFFWMKIPIFDGFSRPLTNKSYFEEFIPRIEYGPSVKNPSSNKTEDGGSYSVSHLPFAAVTVNKTKMNVEYFEIGECKYSYTIWRNETPQGSQPVPFKISNLSSFYS
jgi:hypothetical protein